MARKYVKRNVTRNMKKRTSGTSSRRKLQSSLMNKQTRRAVNFVTNAVPVAKAAYNLYNIARSRNRVNPRGMPKIRKGTTGGYNQWSQQYDQKTFGRLTTRKIQKMSLDKVIYVHQNIGPFNDGGKTYLSNYNDNVGTKYYPLILFELNCANNYESGTLVPSTAVHQLFQNTATSRMGLSALGSQGPDGTTSQVSWVMEKGSHTAATSMSYPLENAIHAWSSLDLELWGQTQKPTKYHICLCQFSEDVMFPDLKISGTMYYDTIPATNNNANEFWQSLVKSYSYSPLARIDDGYSAKKWKILKQYTINIDPTANYENDPDPHVKTLKLFYRFNRKCNFQWKFADTTPQTVAEMNDADWKQEDGENFPRVHPNARMFVMIRASNYTPIIAPTVPSTTTSPSISWRMRSCFLINQ